MQICKGYAILNFRITPVVHLGLNNYAYLCLSLSDSNMMSARCWS